MTESVAPATEVPRPRLPPDADQTQVHAVFRAAWPEPSAPPPAAPEPSAPPPAAPPPAAPPPAAPRALPPPAPGGRGPGYQTPSAGWPSYQSPPPAAVARARVAPPPVVAPTAPPMPPVVAPTPLPMPPVVAPTPPAMPMAAIPPMVVLPAPAMVPPPVAWPDSREATRDESLIDLFLRGDWGGAVRGALAGVGAMFLLGVILLAGAGGLSFGSAIVTGAAAVALACGGRLDVTGITGSGASGGAGSALGGEALSLRPLTLTFVGFGLLAVIFVRQSRALESRAAVGFQATRLALCLAIVLIPVSVIGNLGRHTLTVGYFSTIGYGVVTLLVALVAGAILGLPGLFPGWLGRWREAVAGPLRASLWFVALACLVVLAVFSWEIQRATAGPFGLTAASVRSIIAGLLLVLPNIAIPEVYLGPVLPFTGLDDHLASLRDLAVLNEETVALWILLAVVVALYGVAGALTARHRPPGRRWTSLWLGLTLPVVLFVSVLAFLPAVDAALLRLLLPGAGLSVVLALAGGLVGAMIPRAADDQPDPAAWRP